MNSRHGKDNAGEFLKKWCIALTGGIGTGKSTVAGILRHRGYHVFDADLLARDVVAPNSGTLQSIVDLFGPSILNKDGTLNRPALRDLVFSDTNARARLENIMHPAIRKQLFTELQRLGLLQKPGLCFYEAALVHETGSAPDFREIWATVCPPEVQVDRLRQNRGVDRQLAERLLASQMASDRKATLSTRIIDTSGSLESVEQQLERLLAALA